MPRQTPLTFDGRAGVLHQAPGGRGVVIVGSHGFEDLCAHRSLLFLAESLAEAGMPALRFDLSGVGDSKDHEDDGATVQRWLGDVNAAIGELRRLTGVADVALVGLRLGALLAAEAAATRGDISRLALLAPPSNGKAYMRELKVLSRVIAPSSATEHSPQAVYPGLELAGFRLGPDAVEAIKTLDWPKAPPSPDTLSVVANAAPSWSAETDPRARVERMSFAGYDRMMCDPTATVAPIATLQAIANWIARDAPQAARSQPPAAVNIATRLDGTMWRENIVVFGDNDGLSGVLCRPARDAAARAMILTNAGGVRRIGWGGQWVETARRLAADGIATLRMDFSNLAAMADAGETPGCHYGDEIWREVVAAAGLLTREGFNAISAVGACSGAYHCLRAARADTRIDGLVLINQLCYQWGSEYALPLSAWMMQKAADVDRKRRAEDEDLSEIARIQARLIATAVQAAKIGAKGAYRALQNIRRLLVDRATHTTDATDLPEHQFSDLAARGARLDLVFSEADPSLLELERWFGPDGARATAIPGVFKTILPAADHLLTPRPARAALQAVLREHAWNRSARSTAPEGPPRAIGRVTALDRLPGGSATCQSVRNKASSP